MRLAAAVLSGFVLALLAPWISRILRGAASPILALLPLALTIHFARMVGPVASGQAITEVHPWAPSLGVALSFRADGWSLLFALLISGVGALVIVFAGAYLAEDPQRGRFHAYLLAFMASMLGLVLADNLIALYVFWELTTVASYFLIGHHHEDAASRAGAWQALLVTSAGGLCLLAGVILLGIAGGSLEASVLLGRGEIVRAHPLYIPSLVLIVLAAATKSAQFPFHFWLPGAMAAPTPVSAYLHSATMVQAGVYLLARLHPVLGGTDASRYGLLALGVATMLTGSYLAWMQDDLKRILAYSTIVALGTLVMLIGWGSETAILAAVVYLAAHTAYKGALFLVSGSVDHATGTRDVTRLGRLRRAMPITSVAAVLSALSMAGLPPWLGFTGKEMVNEAVLSAPDLLIAAVLAGVATVAAAGLAGLRPFFGRTTPPGEPHEVGPSMWIGPLLLGVAGLALGLWPAAAEQALFFPAAGAVLAVSPADLPPIPHGLSLWHHGALNVVLILGAATIAAGVALYAAREPLRRAARPLGAVLRWGPERGYDLAFAGFLSVARFQTRLLQSGYLRRYLVVTIVTIVALVGAGLVRAGDLFAPIPGPEIRFHEALLSAVVLCAAAIVARSRSRFAAVTAFGVVGYGVALIFGLYAAPDLAMTQFATETLSLILIVLVLARMPRRAAMVVGGGSARDAIVALAAGVLSAGLVLLARTGSAGSRLAAYFIGNSEPRGHGRNVVNVILVDFRALDTLGEITVVTVAALGAYSLLRMPPEAPR